MRLPVQWARARSATGRQDVQRASTATHGDTIPRVPSIGPLELAIVLVIVLLIFGPKRLPGLGRQLGTGMREFKDSITGKDTGDADAEQAPPERIEAAPAEPVAGESRAEEQPRADA